MATGAVARLAEKRAAVQAAQSATVPRRASAVVKVKPTAAQVAEPIEEAEETPPVVRVVRTPTRASATPTAEAPKPVAKVAAVKAKATPVKPGRPSPDRRAENRKAAPVATAAKPVAKVTPVKAATKGQPLATVKANAVKAAAVMEAEPVKRGRGRPRKDGTPAQPRAQTVAKTVPAKAPVKTAAKAPARKPAVVEAEPVKRSRGRPRKDGTPAQPRTQTTAKATPTKAATRVAAAKRAADPVPEVKRSRGRPRKDGTPAQPRTAQPVTKAATRTPAKAATPARSQKAAPATTKARKPVDEAEEPAQKPWTGKQPKFVTSPMSNRDHARKLFEKGKTRREIADQLGIAYATVYAHTADMAGESGRGANRPRVFVEILRDGKRVVVGRSEAMREDFMSGLTIGDIARKYGVIYQVAYQSCKSLFEDEE